MIFNFSKCVLPAAAAVVAADSEAWAAADLVSHSVEPPALAAVLLALDRPRSVAAAAGPVSAVRRP